MECCRRVDVLIYMAASVLEVKDPFARRKKSENETENETETKKNGYKIKKKGTNKPNISSDSGKRQTQQENDPNRVQSAEAVNWSLTHENSHKQNAHCWMMVMMVMMITLILSTDSRWKIMNYKL